MGSPTEGPQYVLLRSPPPSSQTTDAVAPAPETGDPDAAPTSSNEIDRGPDSIHNLFIPFPNIPFHNISL